MLSTIGWRRRMRSNDPLRDPPGRIRPRIRPEAEGDEPTLDELLSVERREQHAHSLAAADVITDAPRRGHAVLSHIAEDGHEGDAPSQGRLRANRRRWDSTLVTYPSAEAERYGWATVFGPDPLDYALSRYGRVERACTSVKPTLVARVSLTPDTTSPDRSGSSR